MVAALDKSQVISSIRFDWWGCLTSELFVALRAPETIALSDHINVLDRLFLVPRWVRARTNECGLILHLHFLGYLLRWSSHARRIVRLGLIPKETLY